VGKQVISDDRVSAVLDAITESAVVDLALQLGNIDSAAEQTFNEKNFVQHARRKRVRHLDTVSLRVSRHRAISSLSRPSAAMSTIFALTTS